MCLVYNIYCLYFRSNLILKRNNDWFKKIYFVECLSGSFSNLKKIANFVSAMDEEKNRPETQKKAQLITNYLPKYTNLVETKMITNNLPKTIKLVEKYINRNNLPTNDILVEHENSSNTSKSERNTR